MLRYRKTKALEEMVQTQKPLQMLRFTAMAVTPGMEEGAAAAAELGMPSHLEIRAM